MIRALPRGGAVAYVEDRWKSGKAARAGKGRRYRVRYLGPDGRERSRSFDRKLDADRFRSSVETDLLRGTYIDPDAGRITLRRYAEEAWFPSQTCDAPSLEKIEARLRVHILPALGD